MSRDNRKVAAPRAAAREVPAAPAAGRPWATTTFRLYRDHLIALQREALERRAGGAAGRADASAVLRDILDEHFKHGAGRS
jgi:hypothetical protein